MEPFRTYTGLVVPLDRANVDTDQIIPKQFLRSIAKTGYGDNLFDSWRYLDDGETLSDPHHKPNRQPNPDFVLNERRFQLQSPGILLARRNFGCGSSREHAVWALVEYGFRVVLAPDFGDIFFANACKNGLLPVVLDEAVIADLFERSQGEQLLRLQVDLEAGTVCSEEGEVIADFSLNPIYRNLLLKGLDEIGMTLEMAEQIRTYEASARQRMPWLFERPASENP